MRWFSRFMLFVSFFIITVAHATPADDIRSLLEMGKAKDAYQAGQSNPDQMGNTEFDFYFGIAAIDSGHSAEGVLALERYVLNAPGDTRARLELGRGYFIEGDDARARDEFSAVLALNPPASVKTTIQRYLEALREREGRYKTIASVYLEAGMGYDDNVNSGVANSEIVLPLFGQVQVVDAGVRRGDIFSHLAVGGQIARAIAPGVSLFGAVQADERIHQSEGAFDLSSIGASGGVSWRKNENLWRGSLFTSSLSVDNAHYRDIGGASAEWHRRLDELRSFNLFGQYAFLSYSGFNRVRDSSFRAVGGGFRQVIATLWQPVFTLSGNLGSEGNHENREDLSRHIYGLNLGLALMPAPKWNAAATLTYQRSFYDACDPFLNVARKDGYGALNLSATYFIQQHFSVRAEISVVKNSSNLELYQYTRNSAALKLRYDLK